MQAKPNQTKYYCPMCEEIAKHDVSEQFGNEIHRVYCTNEDCDVYGVSWDIKKLEQYEINKVARVEELLNV